VAGGLRFRHRIGLLVALAALGLVTVTTVTLGLGRRGEHQLSGIETRYVPLIELDRDLKTLFAQITRALSDAASAAEESRLADADRLVAQLEGRLVAAATTLVDNGGDPEALRAELRVYYTAARKVSVALLGGASAAQLATEIDAMHRLQQLFTAHLDLATAPDRTRMAAAFATTRASLREALWVDIAVASGVLALMGFLSWRLIRRTARSLQAVSQGVARLARGEFGTAIEVTSRDEFGDLAREGNETAERLREYRERTEALLHETQRQAQELARGSKHKSEFLANMSHELRTPLNSIMILSKILSENDGNTLSAKQIEFAQLINKSGEELLALINEVLDLAKIEAGRQEIILGDIKVADIEDYARRMFSPLAMQKQIGYSVACAEDVPELIHTDWARLTQILKNLVANAFKFTAEGEVRVRIAGADPLVISVHDTGIGIAPEKQAWIFEAFAQAESGTSRTYGGTGLGLTIAKQLAVRLGGDLRLESTLGAGSTFRIVLPVGGPLAPSPAPQPARPVPAPSPLIAEPAKPARPRERAAAPDPVLAGKTVLIVDDDMRNVYSLAASLQTHQLDVVTAGDSVEALAELELHPEICAVLMDLMMPGVDGHATTRLIRERPAWAKLPIIVVTAGGADDERARSVAAGATDVLAKPIDIDRLLEVLRAVISD
jgi:signal transduction histidine kinase